MLDLITLISTMGVQQELSEANRGRKENLVMRDAVGEDEGTLVDQAAEALSSAFDAFDGALAQGMEGVGSFLGVSSTEAEAPVVQTPAKKKVV
mmetsp:Transcript_102036/g.176993  ORF Transcript_102036/g.176993 Transcript_102036/m.176993 type:complete len:93 (-) Transcript_102036:144-422(-)